MNLRKKLTKMLLLLIIGVFSIGTFNSKPAAAMNTGTQPYLGQISLFAFDFAPKGWAECRGQLLPINTNQALFALLGIKFGGNGTTTFQLPNLQNESPITGAKYYIALQGIFPSSGGSGGSNSVVGAISLFPYDFAPSGWTYCDGKTFNIGSNTALFSLLYDNYGSDMQSFFKIPDLRNASPMKDKINYYLCEKGIYPSRSTGGSSIEFIGNIDLYAFKFETGVSEILECKGQTIDINDDTSIIYNIIGTNYGGDGQSNFGIPDLRGAVPSPKMGYYFSRYGVYPSPV